MRLPIVYSYFCLTMILIVALWQLEMVHVAPLMEWGYDFGGFGQLGLELWTWRDFWYIIILIDFLALMAFQHKVLTKEYVCEACGYEK